MSKLEEMMKQAQAMQAQLVEAQAKLDTLEASGLAGGGLVAITLHNKGAIKRITIDKSLMKPDDVEILEDLIIAAYGGAKQNLDALMNEEMQKMTAGLGLPPGMKLPF